MARVNGYEELIAWRKSYRLVLTVYRCSESFPADERFGLVQQIRRAAVSIPSNIAEGWGRSGKQDYARFIEMARGSAYELQTQLRLAKDLGFLHDDEIHEQVAEVERIINGLLRSLRR